MARTRAEIYNQIVAEKAVVTELATLTDEKEIKAALADFAEVQSSSNVSVWRLWCYVVSYVLWAHEQLWELFKLEIAELKAAAILGTPAWLVAKAKEFQNGYSLTVDPVTYQPVYLTIDEAAQIVTRASVKQSGSAAVVKVAKASGALTAGELTAFKAYLNDLQFAGQNLNAVSLPADTLRIEANVYYDATLDLATVQAAVSAAITTYIADNIPFDGVILRNGIVDAVQAVSGVSDIDVNILQGGPDGGTLSDIDRVYETVSGYAIIDGSYPLSSTLTYVPD